MIELINLRKEYENAIPIKNLSTTINKGDVISVIGPSGTGKSTLLRMINMLERPTSGNIIIDDEDVTVPGYPLHKVRQKVGMVFQSFNLFNNMTIIENVCFGPELKGVDPKEAYKKGMDILDRVGLARVAFSYPYSLSGGQKQRAAIARTIANEPEIILFDEPTSALDPAMVGEVESVITALAKEGYTMMLVTHDMKFAEKVSSRVLYLDEGGIYDDGTPEQIFVNPTKEKTAEFIKKLQDFSYVIDKKNNDFPDIFSKINGFCFKNEVDASIANKIRAVTEELAIITVSKISRIDSNDDLHATFTLSYSRDTRTAHIIMQCENFTFDLNNEDSDNNNSIALIKHYSSDITYNDEHFVFMIKD